MPLLFLALILIAFPVLEIWLLIKLAHHYGWWLFAYLASVAALGWRLIQDEKLMLLGRVMQNVGQGGTLTRALFGSVKNLVAGVLLIIPGVMTDALAVILLLIPATQDKPGKGPLHGRKAANDDVIEGEFRRED